MDNILHFKSKVEKAKEFLSELVLDEKTDSIDTIVLAMKDKEGQWVTGYFNANWAVRNEAIGHIQADIIDQMILANLDRYNQ